MSERARARSTGGGSAGTRPLPRPALRKAADGSIHPAAPRTSALAVEAEEVRAAAKGSRKGGGGGKGDRDGKGKVDKHADAPVTLEVTVPRSLRKALKRKADGHGWTAEEAAAHVLRAWVDG